MSQQMIDHERDAFAKLTGKFRHYCHDWDGMAIDQNCHEFTCCQCTFEPALEAEKADAQLHLESICPRCGVDASSCECATAKAEIDAISADDLLNL